MAKHPVPKKKASQARSNRRYKSFQNFAQKRLIDSVKLTKCVSCGADCLMHHACKECGSYRGKGATAKKEEKITKIQA